MGSVLTTIRHDLATFVTFPAKLAWDHLPVVERREEAGPRWAGFTICGPKETGPLGTGRFRASGEEVLL
jgi:hypothetical protein